MVNSEEARFLPAAATNLERFGFSVCFISIMHLMKISMIRNHLAQVLIGLVAFSSGPIFTCFAAGKLDVSNLKPGQKLEYQQSHDEWITVEYVGKGPTNFTLMIKRPPFNRPVSTPIDWLRLPASGVRENLNAGTDTSDAKNPFATEAERKKASKSRIWSDTSGKFKIEATLARVEEGKVVLTRADNGNEITVPLEKLSEVDRKFVAASQPVPPEPSATQSKNQQPGDAKTAAKVAIAKGASQDDSNKATKEEIEIAPTDFSSAPMIDLTVEKPWTYKPDPAPPDEKLKPVVIPLLKWDTSERPQRLLLLPKEKKAFVVTHDLWSDQPVVHVQACNLQTAKAEASAEFGVGVVPREISPDGALVLAGTQTRDFTADLGVLRIYSRAGLKVSLLCAWRPYPIPTDEHPKAMREGTKSVWASFNDDRHLLTCDDHGTMVMWEVPALKSIWMAHSDANAKPTISAGRKYVVARLANKMVFVKADSGEIAGSLDTGPTSLWGESLDFNNEGTRLAASHGWQLRVWDLHGPQLMHDFQIQLPEGPNGSYRGLGRPAWLSDKYLMLGQMLIDLERRIPVWENTDWRAEVMKIDDGLAWVIADANRPGSKTLSAVSIPDKTMLDAAAKLNPDDLLVMRPGMTVSIEMQISAAPERVAKAKEILETHLENSGMKVTPDGKLKLVVSVLPGKTETMQYRKIGTIGNSEERQVSGQIFRVAYELNGETIWKYDSIRSAPTFIQPNKDESLDAALQRTSQQQIESFLAFTDLEYMALPTYLVKVPNRETQK